MAATGEQAQVVIPQCKLDRICENFDLVKLAEEIVSWKDYAPYCGLSPAAEWEIKENSRAYGVQKRRMLGRWKKRSGNDATYRNLAGIFERAGDQMLADLVYKLAQNQEQTDPHNRNYEDQRETMQPHNQDQGETVQPHNQDQGETERPHNQDQRETVRPHNQDQGETERPHNQDQGETERPHNQDLRESVRPHNQDQGETELHHCSFSRNLVICLIVLIVLTATIISLFLLQPVKDFGKNSTLYRPTQNYTQYVDKVKQRYKTHLHDVPQSFWLPANMDTFIQLSLTSRDKPRVPKVDHYSANQRIVSERSMTLDNLLSEIDASPGSRILVVGQPGIGKTTLLQMITRSWAHDRALSSCWILLHIVLRDLVLLQHAPNLTTFLSFMETMNLPPDIETFFLESDGKGLCFIADGLDEYSAGYEDKTNFIFSELIGAQKPNIKLAQSTVVISSRPEVTSQVRHLFDKRVEVLGFGNNQINEYIQAKYGEDKSFSKYLAVHPHIKHTCYIPLHLAMLVYLKDYLGNLPETETEMYEQFIIHTLIRDFCKNPTSSCSPKNTLATSLNNISKSLEVGSLLFHIAKLAYIGSQKKQSIFTEVEPVLQHTNSSLLVVDKMSVLHQTTYSFPHLTTQEFLAAFYFNTYLSQQEQKSVLVDYSKHQEEYHVKWVFWKFCCGLKRNENQTTFLEFFNLLYQYDNESNLPYRCAYEARSLIASQQLINFTGGIVELTFLSYYDPASVVFVVVSAAENLLEIRFLSPRFSLQKLCETTTNYYQLREISVSIFPSNIGCLLQKSPNLESLFVSGLNRDMLQSKDAAALVLPPYGTNLLNIRHIYLQRLNIGDKGVEKLYQLLQDSSFLETLSLEGNCIGDRGASAIADLMKVLPHLQHVHLSDNHIGGRGAALLWNQSIHKCSNYLNLDFNDIGDDRPDAFISALSGTVNSGYEGNKSCQLKVRVTHNEFLCSDFRDILTVSKRLPKGVMVEIDYHCLERIQKIAQRFLYCIGNPYKVGLHWISYAVCTFHIYSSTKTKLWGLLYSFNCIILYTLSSYNNFMWAVDSFNYILSFLWLWTVVGRIVCRVSLKVLFKLRCWVPIIAVVVQLYYNFTLIDYYAAIILYLLLISGYVLFGLGLFPLCYYLGNKFCGRHRSSIGYKYKFG